MGGFGVQCDHLLVPSILSSTKEKTLSTYWSPQLDLASTSVKLAIHTVVDQLLKPNRRPSGFRHCRYPTWLINTSVDKCGKGEEKNKTFGIWKKGAAED